LRWSGPMVFGWCEYNQTRRSGRECYFANCAQRTRHKTCLGGGRCRIHRRERGRPRRPPSPGRIQEALNASGFKSRPAENSGFRSVSSSAPGRSRVRSCGYPPRRNNCHCRTAHSMVAGRRLISPKGSVQNLSYTGDIVARRAQLKCYIPSRNITKAKGRLEPPSSAGLTLDTVQDGSG